MIRLSGRDEAETHFAIQRAACVVAFAHVFPPELYPFPDDTVRAQWRAYPGRVFVAEDQGEVVGVVGVDGCWLTNLYVLPSHWGRGIGAALHDEALAAIPDCPEVRLWTLEENHRARAFYERRGWRQNGETRVVPFPPRPLDVGYTYIREEP